MRRLVVYYIRTRKSVREIVESCWVERIINIYRIETLSSRVCGGVLYWLLRSRLLLNTVFPSKSACEKLFLPGSLFPRLNFKLDYFRSHTLSDSPSIPFFCWKINIYIYIYNLIDIASSLSTKRVLYRKLCFRVWKQNRARCESHFGWRQSENYVSSLESMVRFLVGKSECWWIVMDEMHFVRYVLGSIRSGVSNDGNLDVTDCNPHDAERRESEHDFKDSMWNNEIDAAACEEVCSI